MATNTPIPPNPIGESFVWRDWLQKLSDRVFGTAATLDVPIQPQYGGTGLTTYSTGNIIYSNATDNLTRLAPPSSTSILQMTSAGVPSWVAYGPAFSAYPTTAQTISSAGTLVKVNFGTEEFDTNNNFASSTFTPTTAGYYQVDSCVRLDGGGPGTGECMIVVFKNGSEAKRGWNSSGTAFATDWWSMSVSTLVYCNGTTDYLEIYIQQVSGGSRTTTPYANISYFQAFLARPA